MPKLLSNRKPVRPVEKLTEDRFKYLGLNQAQPALGAAPSTSTGYTLQTDVNGKVSFATTLGNLEFQNQTISTTLPGDMVFTNTNGNIVISPLVKAQVNGNLEILQNIIAKGDNPLGTAPVVSNVLYVTMDGDDRNDGRAMDASRACRTISGAVRSPYYQEGTVIKVSSGHYYEENPIPLKGYTCVIGDDLRTVFIEPLNRDLDLFHVNSGVYIAQMQMRNLRRGSVERYAPGGAGTYTTGAYCVAFPPNLENPIDVYYSPYIQNCTNQTGPWLKDGTMFVPNQTVQIPLAAGVSSWVGGTSTITVSIVTGTIAVGMAVNDGANEGYRNAQLLLKANKEFLQAEVVAYVDDTYQNLTYNKELCYRDIGLIVDAIAGDARFGGNQRTLIAGLSYWDGATSLIPGEGVETVAAINYLETLVQSVIVNNLINVNDLYQIQVSQVINTNYDKGSVVSTRITNLIGIITDIITNGPDAEPERVLDLNGLIYPTGLSPNRVNVASTVTNVVNNGNGTFNITLSSPTVSPSDNATVYFGYTSTYPFLDEDVPEIWTAADNDGIFADRRLDPHGAGGGALVDGNAPSLRSPIQSFVFDAFTQVCQGGRGIHIINNGYAQLVSVFTLFCDQAVTVENGGIASITNSNANFGDLCLVANGLGKLDFSGIVWNPAYPTNVENGEFYPIGYWPQTQKMEVFIPNDRDRPHIGQVMEVVPPDTYIDYNGDRVPFINEQGFPGYLVATSNTCTLTTGSYTISGIDITNIAVGHTLYVRDIYGETGPNGVGSYITPGAQVTAVRYQEIELDLPILNGGGDPTNLNFLNLYFCGNAYYTVLSSRLDDSLASTFTSAVSVIPSERTTTTQAIAYARDLALQVIANHTATIYQTDVAQVIDHTYTQGVSVSAELAEKFNTIISIITGTSTSSYTINGQFARTDQPVLDAKKLLEKNRNFIQAQTVAYTDTLWPKVFNYNSDVCARDTKLIVDALAQDLIFGGTSQSTFAGIQYYSQGNTFIPGEITTTTRAINYASDLAQKIVLNDVSGYRYQNSFTQLTSVITATSAEALIISKDFSVITDILKNGISYITDTIVPNGITTSSNLNVVHAFNNLQANKQYIQHEVVAYVDSTSNFKYNTTSCYRDVGLFIDSIAFDLAYPSTYDSQTTFAALQYWNNNGYVGQIASEITTTTAAVTYLSQIAQKVVLSQKDYTPYQNSVVQTTSSFIGTVTDAVRIGTNFGIILNILSTGTVGVTNNIVANERATNNTTTNYAYNLLLANKAYLQTEVLSYITSPTGLNYPTTSFNSSTCVRDIGYMIDSIAFDLLHGGNRQSIQSAVYYYNYTTSTVVTGEIPQVNAAYTYMKSLIGSIVTGQTVTPSPGNTVPQITYMLPASTTEVNKLKNLVDKILTIINNGPSSVSNKTPISLTPSSQPDADKAFDLLLANKTFIQTEITQWINNNFCGFTYNRSKCFRDVGYMIDSISIDLLYGGNRQAVQSGVYYYGHTSTYAVSSLNDEIPQVNAAYQFLKNITSNIVRNIPVVTYQDKITQTFSNTTGTLAESSIISNNINLILSIINTGTIAAPAPTSLGVVPSSTSTVLAAAQLLHNNRDFIAAETISYINETYHTGFVYDKKVCKRDTGLIVESLAFDLLYSGSSQSAFSGLQYWGQSGYTGQIGAELTTTTNAMRYLREIVEKVILKETVSKTSTNVSTQTLSLSAGSVEAAQSVVDNMTTIIDIIVNGKTSVTDKIVSNGSASTSTGIVNAYNILRANKTFLQSEVVARINLDNPYFDYDQNTCYRDVGYIVDSLSFDLLHGGNRQSIQSGVYYTSFDGTETVIKDEKVEVNAAYNHIKSLIPNIITGQEISNLYQPKVYQNKNLHVHQVRNLSTGTLAQATAIQNNIDLIIDIINDGPSAAPAKTPIGLTSSTSVFNAYNILLANKEFIQAETLAFIDANYTYVETYNKNKCYRDMGSIIDSVIYDLLYGGNYRSVNTGNGYYYRNGQYHIITLEQNVLDPLLFIDGATVNFYQQSYISASGYLFEYVGAGTQYGALPQVGFADPVQSKETVQLNNGKVFFTSTDQNGDFRIGPSLVISQATGILSGRTFQKSLYAEMTPFILVIGA